MSPGSLRDLLSAYKVKPGGTCLLLIAFEIGSHCVDSGFSGTHYADQADLKLTEFAS